jgi:TonB family protein
MLSILAAVLMQAATPAVAAPAPTPSVVTTPDWLRKPTGADMAEFYPKAAAAAHVEGHATIHCKVAATGDLTDCVASNDEPAGQGFGEAALRLSPLFKMRPMTRDGVAVSGGRINIPIRFMLPQQEAPPTAEAVLHCYGYAAAEAERNPASQDAQRAVFTFGLILQIRLLGEHSRPTEVAQVLASQLSIATGRLDDPKFKGERDECAVILSSRGGTKLERMFSALEQ